MKPDNINRLAQNAHARTKKTPLKTREAWPYESIALAGMKKQPATRPAHTSSFAAHQPLNASSESAVGRMRVKYRVQPRDILRTALVPMHWFM